MSLNPDIVRSGTAAGQETSPARTCPMCGRPLTQVGSDGECLRCLFNWGFGDEQTDDESTARTRRSPAQLTYAEFQIEVGADGLPIELGAGAMAVTYRAWDTILSCVVALKVIDRKVAENSAARSRFLREARAAAQIHHPNVARVLHYGEQDGECFYAMELVDGETLEARVRRDGPMPLPLALEVIEQVTRAVAAAEACGVVHRDLKPSNIMIESDPSDVLVVKVIDYGVAKIMTPSAELDPDQTQAGFIGTPAFASPEQFAEAGQSRVDSRSDIYSLGITLWYLLSGRIPFSGRTREEIQLEQTRELPLHQLKNARLPAQVIALLKSMLAVDPSARPQSARELLPAVHRCYLRFEPLARSRRRRLQLALSALALIAAVIAIGMWAYQRARSSTQIERSIAVLPFENLSPAEEDAFFTVGMQDEITAHLARIADMKVIGSQSTRSYLPGKPRNLPEIARELGVRHLLEGTVKRANEEVRVSLRLVDTRDSAHPLTETYQRSMADVFVLQSDITRTIAARLRSRLSPNEKSALQKPPTHDLHAYDLYLRAGAEVPVRDEEATRQYALRNIELMEQAVARDPNFALAYCQLAMAHEQFFQFRVGARAAELLVDHRNLAEIALRNARRIDPNSGELHLAQAYYFFRVANDLDQARLEANLARQTLPNNAEVESISGRIARGQGRWEDAIRYFERTVALEPRRNDDRNRLAQIYRGMRRYDESDRIMKKMIDADPEHQEDLPLERAVLRLEQRAETDPLRAALAERAAAHELTETDRLIGEFILAWYGRDADAMTAMWGSTKLGGLTRNGVFYPEKWFEALAARIRGDAAAAQAAFAAVRSEVESATVATPDNGRTLGLLAIIDAGLGRREEAVTEARRARELTQKSAIDAPIGGCNLAIVYAWTGQIDLALATLDPLINGPAAFPEPSQPTYGDFRLNPMWDPLRSDPRFEALVQRLAPTASR